MFPGSPRKRDGVRVIPLGAVSQIALCGDDPDFIVLEAFDTLFSGTTIALPSEAPIGKQFKFALTQAIGGASLTIEYADIVVPLARLVGLPNTWRLYIGQRPVFTYTLSGWLVDGGSSYTNGVAIGASANGSSRGVAVGNLANANSDGSAIGTSTNGSTYGAAMGYLANGSTYGVAIGYSANGSSNGVAIGYSAGGANGVAIGRDAYIATNGVAVGRGTVGGNGVAVGYQANTNSKDKAVAIGHYSKAERHREFVKSADGASTCLQSFSILDWYGDTTNATQTEIFLGAADQRALVLASSAYMFKLLAVARDNANNVVSAWEITGAIKRDAAGNTALVGSVTNTLIAQDAAAAAWAIAISADDTAEALAIKVTGAAATTIRWNVRGDISELRF